MNWKSTVAFVVVLALLVGYYVFTIKKEEKQQEADEAAKKIYQIDQNDIVELRIAGKDEEAIVCKKSEDEWTIEAPIKVEANSTAIDGVAKDLADAESQRTVDEEAKDLKPYGLDEPSLTISALKQNEEKPSVLLVGNENPTKTGYYVSREGENTVLLVSSYTKGTLDKKLSDLREKTIIKMEQDDVKALDVALDDESASMEKDSEDNWKLAEPVKATADKEKVNKIITELRNAKVKEFIEEEPADLSEYGLDEPKAMVTVYIGEDKARKTILFGDADDDENGVYAKRETAKNVVLLPKTVFDAIPEDLDELRNKSLLLASTGDVVKVEHRCRSGAFLVEKDEQGTWYLKKPVDEKADSLTISGIFSTLKDMKAGKFLTEEKDEFGLDNPQVKTSLWVKDAEEPVAVVIGAENPDTHVLYAKTSEGNVVTIGKDTLDDLNKTLFEFRDKVLVSFDKADAEKISVTYGDEVVELARDGEEWKAEQPEGLKLSSQGVVDQLIWAINYLKMEKIVSGKVPENVTEYGLDNPAASFTVSLKGERTLGPFKIGYESEDAEKPDTVFATLEQRPGLYLVGKDVLNDIQNRLGDITGKELPEDIAKKPRGTDSGETSRESQKPDAEG